MLSPSSHGVSCVPRQGRLSLWCAAESGCQGSLAFIPSVDRSCFSETHMLPANRTREAGRVTMKLGACLSQNSGLTLGAAINTPGTAIQVYITIFKKELSFLVSVDLFKKSLQHPGTAPKASEGTEFQQLANSVRCVTPPSYCSVRHPSTSKALAEYPPVSEKSLKNLAVSDSKPLKCDSVHWNFT